MNSKVVVMTSKGPIPSRPLGGTRTRLDVVVTVSEGTALERVLVAFSKLEDFIIGHRLYKIFDHHWGKPKQAHYTHTKKSLHLCMYVCGVYLLRI